MKIYLAASTSKRGEMRYVRKVLTGFGHDVVSSWLDREFPADYLQRPTDQWPQWATQDLDDVSAADVLVLFSGGGAGGRHVEFGYALAQGKRVYVVGSRENIFHALPEVRVCNDLPELCAALAQETS